MVALTQEDDLYECTSLKYLVGQRGREFTPCSEMCCLTWTRRGMLFNTWYGIVSFSNTHHTRYVPKLSKIPNVRAACP